MAARTVFHTMHFSGLLVAAALTVTLLAGCGPDAGLRSPDYEALDGFKTGTESHEWIRTDLLVGLPWREADEMAHDAGWSTQVIFTVEGEPFPMSLDLRWDRLRLIVVGGEEAGTVTDVYNS